MNIVNPGNFKKTEKNIRVKSRRTFLKTTVAGVTGIALSKSIFASVLSQGAKKHPIHIFTKCLQFLNYDEIAELLAKLGLDGADLSVRAGGQILPENVETDLPKAVNALRKVGLDSNMIVTSINNPEDPLASKVLKTMADLGIKYYRMGYLTYDTKKSIQKNLDGHKFTFERLEKLNREYGVTGNYQNHWGTRVGGPVWDLYLLLKDLDPGFIGIQYDIHHAIVEGGISWPLGMKLLAPWIRTTDIKDFVWSRDEKNEWRVKDVPLGEGMVDFAKYFDLYKSLNIDAPVSIHYEYDLGGAELGKTEVSMSREEIYSRLNKDLSFLKNQFKKYEL